MITFFVEGGIFMYPLLICSILTVAYAIERIIVHARVRKERDQERITREASSMVENGASPDEITGFFERIGRLEGETLAAGYERYSHIAEAERSIEEKRRELQDTAFGAARAYLMRNLPVLGFMVGGATLLGLLGTISGMIRSFSAIAKAGVLGDPTVVARGISEALHTTVSGLSIALVGLIVYSIFRARAERKAAQFEPYAYSFVDTVLRSGRKEE